MVVFLLVLILLAILFPAFMRGGLRVLGTALSALMVVVIAYAVSGYTGVLVAAILYALIVLHDGHPATPPKSLSSSADEQSRPPQHLDPPHH